MGRNVQIVQTAQHQPGGDLITGDPEGPFLDLGLRLGAGKARKNDHIYLSLKHLAPVLRAEGWLTPEDAESLVDRAAELEDENERLKEAEGKLDGILEAVSQFFEPEVVEKEVVREVPRKPTEGELRAFVRRHRTELLRTQDRASDERYRETYKGLGYLGGETPAVPLPGIQSEPHKDDPRHPVEPVNKLDAGDDRVPTTAERDEVKPDNVVTHFQLEGQLVDLDEVLSASVKDVIAFAKGHGDEFKEALVEREYALGDLGKGSHPRKGVVEGLGYEWEEDADGAPTKDPEAAAETEQGATHTSDQDDPPTFEDDLDVANDVNPDTGQNVETSDEAPDDEYGEDESDEDDASDEEA